MTLVNLGSNFNKIFSLHSHYSKSCLNVTGNVNPKEWERTTSKLGHFKIAGTIRTKIRRSRFSQKKVRGALFYFSFCLNF